VGQSLQLERKSQSPQDFSATIPVPTRIPGGTHDGTQNPGADGLRFALERCQDAARHLPSENLPELIGQLEVIKAMAWARLISPTASSQPHDELLSVEVAAERLGVSKDYLYRHAQDYSFTRRQGRKLLFSAHGIEKHIRQK
jgi:hypothetical protein